MRAVRQTTQAIIVVKKMLVDCKVIDKSLKGWFTEITKNIFSLT